MPSDRLVDNPLESTETGDKVNVSNPDPGPAVARNSRAKPPSL